MKLRIAIRMAALGLMVVGASAIHGQDFPHKPIRMVTGATGGGTDIIARLISPGVSSAIGQSIIVDNRGGDINSGEIVARGQPDGHTLLLTSSGFWLAPFLYSGVPWDPLKDFIAITLAANSPNLLVVHPALPVKSVKELIALAKAKPGELNYGGGGVGSAPHLAAELFKSMAGVDVVRVGYKGGGPSVIGLIGGETQLMIGPAGGVSAHVKSGKLRALAVTSAQPSPLFPGMPTVAASGVPGYESGTSYGVLATAKTPSALVNRLNQELVRVIKQPEVTGQFFSAGVNAVGSSPQEFAAVVKSEMATLGKVIKNLGIRAE